MVYSLFGVSWVMPLAVWEMIKGWKGCFGRHGNGAVASNSIVSHVVHLEGT